MQHLPAREFQALIRARDCYCHAMAAFFQRCSRDQGQNPLPLRKRARRPCPPPPCTGLHKEAPAELGHILESRDRFLYWFPAGGGGPKHRAGGTAGGCGVMILPRHAQPTPPHPAPPCDPTERDPIAQLRVQAAGRGARRPDAPPPDWPAPRAKCRGLRGPAGSQGPTQYPDPRGARTRPAVPSPRAPRRTPSWAGARACAAARRRRP